MSISLTDSMPKGMAAVRTSARLHETAELSQTTRMAERAASSAPHATKKVNHTVVVIERKDSWYALSLKVCPCPDNHLTTYISQQHVQQTPQGAPQ